MANNIELDTINVADSALQAEPRDSLLDSFSPQDPVEGDTRLQQPQTSAQEITSNIENRITSTESSTGSSTLTYVRNQLRYMLTNAPLLRFVVPENRYNALRTTAPMVGRGQDGVFSNMSAKPSVPTGTEPSYQLPSYEEASQDPTPPYWEASIMAGYEDEIFVDGLPVGNIINFLWNMTVSISFQFVGFVITYLLHTSHAAKNGSQAGLGITLISFGYSSIPVSYGSQSSHEREKFEPSSPNSIDTDSSNAVDGHIDKFTSTLPMLETSDLPDTTYADLTPIISYALISFGIFLIFKAIFGYLRAKKAEKLILEPQQPV
ncbi:hypothetical protein KL948_003675 [Ogataea haglerorum]|nr:hypothetical protein KL948_003675 [Ogataea haglerorum]KAG7766259.1 hypothetical protein KL931_004097 [Ogataea haglerorum]